jgi:competence protein ComEC
LPLLSRLGVAWIVGIALARWLNLPWPVVAVASLPFLGVLFLYRDTPRAQIWAVLGLALLAGAWRFAFFQPAFDATHVAFYNDDPEPVTLTGLVVDEPDVRDYYIDLRFRVETLQRNDVNQLVDGLVLVRAPRYPERFYGDRLIVTGKLETPPIFEGFSYKDYLGRFGIHSMVRRPQIELVESKQGSPLWSALSTFKAHASQTINHSLPEPYASLLNGILLGVGTGIPRDLYEDFSLTGTSHILVISGSNISLIAGIFLLLGQRAFGKRLALPLAIAGIILYTFLVGADAAVSRAAIMGILWVLAIWVGRPALAINSLIFSGIILTLVNPLTLWDVGFQLSFMATLGLIVLVPPLERVTFKLLQGYLKTEHVGLAMALFSELLIVTLAAQISTGPLIVYNFGRLSLVSLLTNLLILPAQPPIMILGGIATLAGTLWLPLGQFIGWLVYLPLAWTVWIVELTARLPYASLNLGSFPFWLVILLYAVLAAGIWWAKQRTAKDEALPRFVLPAIGSLETRLVLGGTAVITLVLWLAVSMLPDGRLHVAFLDVGQGDAIFITTPRGQQILVDGGPASSAVLAGIGSAMPFWDRSLDVVVNTHPDDDHLAGLLGVLERYQVSQVILSDVGDDKPLYAAWQKALVGEGATVTRAQAGMRLALGDGIEVEVLHPGAVPAGQVLNDHSVVLRLTDGRVSFLLTGDIQADVEQELVESGRPLAATVLKVAHHGSITSSTPAWLAAVDPQVAVISVGAGNHFGHPSPEVLQRYAAAGIPVLRTDQAGSVEFVTDGQRLWVETTH